MWVPERNFTFMGAGWREPVPSAIHATASSARAGLSKASRNAPISDLGSTETVRCRIAPNTPSLPARSPSVIGS